MNSHKEILVYLARHGTTTLNSQDCFRGPMDVPLDSKGIKDAHKLGYYFEPIELFPVIATSARHRTKETARIVIEKHGDKLSSISNEGLNAWNVGYLGGQPKNDENNSIVEYYADHPDERIPEGESLNEFKSRVRPLIQEAVEIGSNGLPVLLVVHSSVIHEVGDMLYKNHEKILVEPGGVAAIYYDGERLHAEPVFKPKLPDGKADIIT